MVDSEIRRHSTRGTFSTPDPQTQRTRGASQGLQGPWLVEKRQSENLVFSRQDGSGAPMSESTEQAQNLIDLAAARTLDDLAEVPGKPDDLTFLLDAAGSSAN